DSSQVRVAGLGNASFSNALAAGVFAWKYSAIAHQLPCTLEAGRDVAQFGRDRDRRDVGYTAQGLQTPDHFLHGLWSQLHHFQDGLFQSLDSRAHVFEFVKTIP